MRIAFLAGESTIGDRPLDVGKLYDDPDRVFTGTDSSLVGYARGMAERGHLTWLYLHGHEVPDVHFDVGISPIADRAEEEWDVAVVWNDADALDGVRARLKVLNLHGRDFGWACTEDRLAKVDLLCAPSQPLVNVLKPKAPVVRPWAVIPNGYDPTLFEERLPKVPGRCLWASSPDRGLHVALERWPSIRERVPGAELRVCYGEALSRWLSSLPDQDREAAEGSPTAAEHARRIRIVRERIWQPGVRICGTRTVRQMAEEYGRAQVLAYSADTMGWSESFGVSVLEAMAAGCVPVLGGVDAFPSLWGACCPMVEGPAGEHAEEWADEVVALLTDESRRLWLSSTQREVAGFYAWPERAGQLESLVLGHLAEKEGRTR